jgi:hypothetical protein
MGKLCNQSDFGKYYHLIVQEPGGVAEKPSESGNNMPFQRHQCPGPDFKPEKGKNAVFSLKFPLEMPFLPFPTIFNIPNHLFPLRDFLPVNFSYFHCIIFLFML